MASRVQVTDLEATLRTRDEEADAMQRAQLELRSKLLELRRDLEQYEGAVAAAEVRSLEYLCRQSFQRLPPFVASLEGRNLWKSA
jgi:hypothetical protein